MILFNCRIDTYNGRWCVTPEYPSGTYGTQTIFLNLFLIFN